MIIRFHLTKQIGSGSYANVFRYRDSFYNRYLVIKRAKRELTPKELQRFRREFDEMSELSSPYIPEVYRYNKENNEYIMEYMDFTLERFIQENNTTLPNEERTKTVHQILRAFQ